MKPFAVFYWTSTLLLAFFIGSGGLAEVMGVKPTVEGILHLGYPPYFVVIVGSWKVLGSIVILLPKLPRLKEWAYAGIFFNMTGAAISHMVTGDAAWHVVVTLSIAVLALVSWATRPNTRLLGDLLPGNQSRARTAN